MQKAKKKPIKKISSADIGVDLKPRIQVLSVAEPPVRKAGAVLADVDALIGKLKEAGHV